MTCIHNQVSSCPTSTIKGYANQCCATLKQTAHDVQTAAKDAWNAPIDTAKCACKSLSGRAQALLTSKGARNTAIAGVVVMVAVRVKDSQFCKNLYLNAAVKKMFEVGVDQGLRALLFV
jgi:hypothetical protein